MESKRDYYQTSSQDSRSFSNESVENKIENEKSKRLETTSVVVDDSFNEEIDIKILSDDRPQEDMQDDDKNVDLSQNKVETASKHDTCENLLSNIQNQINRQHDLNK